MGSGPDATGRSMLPSVPSVRRCAERRAHPPAGCSALNLRRSTSPIPSGMLRTQVWIYRSLRPSPSGMLRTPDPGRSERSNPTPQIQDREEESSSLSRLDLCLESLERLERTVDSPSLRGPFQAILEQLERLESLERLERTVVSRRSVSFQAILERSLLERVVPNPPWNLEQLIPCDLDYVSARRATTGSPTREREPKNPLGGWMQEKMDSSIP